MNLDTILANAREFLNAYYVLDANRQYIVSETMKADPYSISPKIFERMRSGELKVTNIPEVVSIAFACELLLKAMLLHYANIDSPKGHNHFELMHRLPPPVLDELLRRLAAAVPTMSHERILKSIQDNAEAFVEWRYFHEKGHATHMTNFAVVMAETIMKMLEEARGPQVASDLTEDVL